HILSDAEALCDRVAVIHKGELRGIGVVNDLRSSIAENSEVIWESAQAVPMLKELLTELHITGETVRGVVRNADLDNLLEKLRQQRARLVSVTPLHGTLEDYFMAKTADAGRGTVKL
ncbi:MAG TPA: hypothetical protein VKU42_01785, partial [Candidatus Angelobacter sp.]|nr:hypothetical protein [Candidatus Angelobacter sp.]